MSSNSLLIRAQNLEVGFGISLFQAVSFSISPGQFFSVVGSNGAGKTTLLKTILSLIPKRAGTLDRSPDLVLGYVPQRTHMNPHFPLRLKDAVVLGRVQRRGLFRRIGKKDHEIASACLRSVGLEQLQDAYLHTLSGGQFQRGLIALALAGQPDILILDEPTTGMDIVAEHDFMNLILKLRTENKLAILMVTHDLISAARVSDQLIVIDGNSKTAVVGAPRTSLTSQALSGLFGRPIEAHWVQDDLHLHIAPSAEGGA